MYGPHLTVSARAGEGAPDKIRIGRAALRQSRANGVRGLLWRDIAASMPVVAASLKPPVQCRIGSVKNPLSKKARNFDMFDIYVDSTAILLSVYAKKLLRYAGSK